MRYYPLNRVKTGLQTDGLDFLLNGAAYSGPYYETYDGQHFTGPDPVTGPSQKLLPASISTIKPADAFRNDHADLKSRKPPTEQSAQYLQASKQIIVDRNAPVPFYPQPTAADYKRGAIMRYFTKKRDRPGFVVEINKETYDSLQRIDSPFDYINYETVSTFWQISGPLRDVVSTNGQRTAGIINTNKRLIEAREIGFPGLKDFIGEDYTRFAKPTM